MSGGAYDYVYSKISEIEIKNTATSARRLAFQRVLKLVAEAMHDIEWVDSGDKAPGSENAAIDAVFGALGLDINMAFKATAYDELRNQLLAFFEYRQTNKFR